MVTLIFLSDGGREERVRDVFAAMKLPVTIRDAHTTIARKLCAQTAGVDTTTAVRFVFKLIPAEVVAGIRLGYPHLGFFERR